MRYRLAIFDFDGTLADSSAWFLEILGDLANRYGFHKPNRAEIEELRTKPSREILRQLAIPFWKLPLIARHARGLARQAGNRISLFSGIEEALAGLHADGLKLAIVSSNAEDTIRSTLGARLAGIVDHYECGASMFGKARSIRRVLGSAGVHASEAMLIGDETRDIEAARKAGVAAGAVAWGYIDSAALEKERPTAVFETIQDMQAYLRG